MTRSKAVLLQTHESEVSSDFSELLHRLALADTQRPHEVFKAVIQMVLDQGFFGLLNRFLNRLQLLRDVETGAPLFQHLYRATQMSAGSAQALDNGWVGGVRMRMFHGGSYPLGGLL